VAVVEVDGPVLLVQPPNSSSAATLGAGAKPPEPAGTIGFARAAPHPPKSSADAAVVLLVLAKADVLEMSGLFWAGAGAAGVDQSLLLPHTLASDQLLPPMAPRPLLLLVVVVVVVVAASGLADRLKTEEEAGAGDAAGLGAAGAGAGVDEKSKRSTMAEEAGWAGAGFGA